MGLPYQTLIASVLHEYVTGRLTERADVLESPPGSYQTVSKQG